MRLNLMLLLMLAIAAAGNTQVMPGDSVVVPAAEDLAENARLAAERLRQIGPRLPSESEDPDAPPPSQLPVTSTFFGPAYRVSLSRNPKNTMYLPDSFEADCPLIAGDLVSMNYIDNDPYKPVIGPRASGGDWCTVSHPPGMYTGPCSINRPKPAVGEFRPSLAVVRRSTTTWFRDQLGNNKSIGVSSCSPVRLDAGRYRIYIESDVKLSATSPCVDDETKECSKDRYVKKIYEGGISIDADLPETDRVTDIASLVTAWSGTDPVPSYAEQAELAPDRDPLITEEALDDNPNLYTFVDLLGPTFTHERCTNCHSFEALGGKIEIHIEEDRLSGFMDTYDYYERGRDMRPELAKWIDDELEKTGTIGCHLCHRPDETQLRQFSWLPAMLLGPAGPWDRMSALAICESMPMQNLISGGPEHFRRHVFDDPRIQWAIRVRWTPDEVIQPAPPVTWDEFVEKVDLWIDKGQMRCRPLTPEEERTVEPTPTPTTPPPDDTDRTPDDIGRTSSSADLESPTSNSCDDAKDLPVAELVEEPPPEFRVTEAQQVAIVNTLSVAQIGEADQVGQLLASGSSFTAIQPRWEGLITGLTTGNSQMDVYALVQWVLREYYEETNTDLQLFAAKVRAFNNQKDTIRGFIAENRDNRDEITEQLAAWEDELQQVCDDAQLANVDMQNAMQKQQQTLQMMSNISKMLHDTAMAVIGKIGG